MRRLSIAGIAGLLTLLAFHAPAGAVAEPPDVGSPTVESPTVEPPAQPNQPDPGDPTTAPDDPEGYLCTLTGNLIDFIENDDPTGQAGAVTSVLREQHAGFCAEGDPGGEGEDPLADVKEAVCPVIDQVIAGAAADPTGQVVGVLATVRQELGCPVAEDDGGGGGDPDDGGDDAGTAPSDAGVLGGGAQVAGNGGPLPRTGAGSTAPLALGVIALGSALRKRFLG